jgi:hypothetical protein
MPNILHGGCFCGSIRFRLAGTPRFVCICHCNSCRRAAGGVMVPWATYADSGFHLEQGALAAYASSPGVTREHCPRCGTSLTYRHVDRPGEVDITLASLDDPQILKPTLHIWVQDKPSWVVIADGLPQHPQGADAG